MLEADVRDQVDGGTTFDDTITMPKGYWWQCQDDPSHLQPFQKAAGLPLVRFLFALADSNWQQERLRATCLECGRKTLRIAYEFPRKQDRKLLLVEHIVGLQHPGYLPMVWEGLATDESEHWFDFKYVGRGRDGRYRSIGLARPAVFTRADLTKLFETYERVAGHSLWEPAV